MIDHELLIKELPKTKRAHLIRLDSATVTMLRSWRARQNEERLLVGPGYDDRGFVFCHPDGSPYDPDRFSREFRAATKLEHPNVVRALDMGVDGATVYLVTEFVEGVSLGQMIDRQGGLKEDAAVRIITFSQTKAAR